jgi:hypothetical protein
LNAFWNLGNMLFPSWWVCFFPKSKQITVKYIFGQIVGGIHIFKLLRCDSAESYPLIFIEKTRCASIWQHWHHWKHPTVQKVMYITSSHIFDSFSFLHHDHSVVGHWTCLIKEWVSGVYKSIGSRPPQKSLRYPLVSVSLSQIYYPFILSWSNNSSDPSQSLPKVFAPLQSITVLHPFWDPGKKVMLWSCLNSA